MKEATLTELMAFQRDSDYARHGLIPLTTLEELQLHNQLYVKQEQGFVVIGDIVSHILRPGYDLIAFRLKYEATFLDGQVHEAWNSPASSSPPLIRTIVWKDIEQRKVFGIAEHKF